MNEITTNNQQASAEILVEDTPKYAVYQMPDGRFEKRMKYQKFWSFVPETNEELINLFQIMNEQDNPNVIEFKSAIGEVLDIKNVYFNPYSSFDEETGTTNSGVTTTIETVDGKYYATSSKTVYYNLQNIFDVFGTPNTDKYLGVKVAIVSTKRQQGNQISLKLIGLSDK